VYERFIRDRLVESLADTPVVLLVGPRRAGKTTLARSMSNGGRVYLTLDDQTTLEAAKTDPVAFVRGLDLAIIDEVQRVPELMLAIKKAIDDDYRPGRFLLTGSANVMTLPRVADSLAGRMETIKLLPLSRSEVLGRRSDGYHEIRTWADDVKLERVHVTVASSKADLIEYFASFGFRVEGFSPNRYPRPAAELVMAKHFIRQLVRTSAELDQLIADLCTRFWGVAVGKDTRFGVQLVISQCRRRSPRYR